MTSKRLSTLKQPQWPAALFPLSPISWFSCAGPNTRCRNRLDSALDATGLTMPQYAVLAELEREGELSASELAREFGMTAQTVNVLVKSLEASGLLRRNPSPPLTAASSLPP